MSWLFSQALVAEYSAENFSDGELSAPLSVMPTPHKFWHNDKMTEPSNLSRYGLTCQVLTATRGEELLMSYLSASRVRISVHKETEPVSMEMTPDNGKKYRALSMKYDHLICGLRTHHCLFQEDLTGYSVILPRWGMMQNGELWGLINPEHHIDVIESGLKERFPTPTASRTTILDMEQAKVSGTSGKRKPFKEMKKEMDGGMLNPNWVEWLMGWPIGHTDLKPLETDKLAEWYRWHGVS